MADDELADEEFLASLRSLAARIDPTPDAVIGAAEGAFAWRTIEAELAELVYDSSQDERSLAGVRGTDAGRLLTFEGDAMTVDVEVAEAGPRRRLIGQLAPPGPAHVRVRHGGGEARADADALGRFALDGVAAGPASLRVSLPDGRQVDTSWIVI